MLRVKSYLFLVGLLVVILAGICLTASAHASLLKTGNLEWKAKEACSVYSSPVSVPVNRSRDADCPEIKASGSYNQAQTPIFVRVIHSLYCLFEISRSDVQFSESQPQVYIALNRFYTTLLTAVISPNAP